MDLPVFQYNQSFPHRQLSSTSSGGDQVELCIENHSDGPDHRDISRAFAQFTDVQEGTEAIRYNNKSLKSILTDMTTTIQYQKLGDLLEEKRQRNLTEANKIYAIMKKIEGDLPEQGDYSALARIKMCQYMFHREDFMKAWAEHEAFLVSYEERMKKLLVRQAKISE